MLLRDAFASYDGPLLFVLDRDPGLGPAFQHAFVEEIREGRAMIAQVAFHKGFSNDDRMKTVMVGRQQLSRESGKTLAELAALTDKEYAALVDQLVATQLLGYAFGGRQWFDWPYHTKSEPLKKVQFLTDDALLDQPTKAPHTKARLVRLATLRAVDSYFHRVRSNLRFAARPEIPPRQRRAKLGSLLPLQPGAPRQGPRNLPLRAQLARRPQDEGDTGNAPRPGEGEDLMSATSSADETKKDRPGPCGRGARYQHL